MSLTVFLLIVLVILIKKQSAIGIFKETLSFIFNEHLLLFSTNTSLRPFPIPRPKKTGVPGKSHKQQRLEQPNSLG